jgi:uncharacterized protein YkwD
MAGRRGMLGILLVLCALVLAAPAAARHDGPAQVGHEDGLEAPLLDAVNDVREERGLRPLRLSPRLAASAEFHSLAMARLGFFSHESADGSEFWRRIARYYPRAGFARWAVGENLLWASPAVGAEKAVELWLASPPHRKILLDPAWIEIGIAAVHADEAGGVFGGREVTVVTADFGARA